MNVMFAEFKQSCIKSYRMIVRIVRLKILNAILVRILKTFGFVWSVEHLVVVDTLQGMLFPTLKILSIASLWNFHHPEFGIIKGITMCIG